jgi:hypothetical protein
MFEELEARARRLAEARAGEKARELAERLAKAMPGGVKFPSENGWITLNGDALRRRLAASGALRAALWGLIDER